MLLHICLVILLKQINFHTTLITYNFIYKEKIKTENYFLIHKLGT